MKNDSEDSKHKEGDEIKFNPADFLRENLEKYNSTNYQVNYIQDNKSTTKKLIKSTVIFLLIIGVISGVYIVFSTIRNSNNKQLEEDKAISELAARYNAITDWKEQLDELDDVYSIDVENALIRKDKRPLLISAYVQDIVTKNGIPYLIFSEVGSPDIEITFILEYDSGQIEQLIKQVRENNEIALIASITTVQKANESSDKFLANGRCLELLNQR